MDFFTFIMQLHIKQFRISWEKHLSSGSQNFPWQENGTFGPGLKYKEIVVGNLEQVKAAFIQKQYFQKSEYRFFLPTSITISKIIVRSNALLERNEKKVLHNPFLKILENWKF